MIILQMNLLAYQDDFWAIFSSYIGFITLTLKGYVSKCDVLNVQVIFCSHAHVGVYTGTIEWESRGLHLEKRTQSSSLVGILWLAVK